MWEEAVKVDLFGLQVYLYGLMIAAGAAAGLIVTGILTRGRKMKKGTAALTGVCSVLAGLIFSRVLFCLLDGSMDTLAFKARTMITVTSGGWSMTGALAGACAGAVLAAKLTGQSAGKLLDCLTPGLLLMIVFARFAESRMEGFGISRPLIYNELPGTFLAQEGDYDTYLNTWMLEAAAALVLFICLLIKNGTQKKIGNGYLFITAVLFFCWTQIVLESLRFDQHMRISFVSLQQILYMVLLFAALCNLCVQLKRKTGKMPVWPLISVPVAAAVCVGIEFGIDRSNMNRYLLYAAYILVIFVPVWAGLRMKKELEQ